MTISAEIIADSIGRDGEGNAPRLTTFKLRYPRFIHAELMTHRAFSRNASSSRAIPVAKMIERIVETPAKPVHWGKNQPGMQAHSELEGDDLLGCQADWEAAMLDAVRHARNMIERGAHKQIANRILEPFMHIDVLVTASNFSNFFHLRCHPDAQPEIKALADVMWDAYDTHTPDRLPSRWWHLPFIRESDYETFFKMDGINRVVSVGDNGFMKAAKADELAIRCSVARCARVSYSKHDGSAPSVEEDLALYERLVGSVPLHASPAEHQACVDSYNEAFEHSEYSGNFGPGWIQYRKLLNNEHVTEYKKGQSYAPCELSA